MVEICVESTCALFLLVCIDLYKGRENSSFLVDVDYYFISLVLIFLFYNEKK